MISLLTSLITSWMLPQKLRRDEVKVGCLLMAPTTLFQRRITLQFLARFCRSATTTKALIHATVLTHANTKKVLNGRLAFWTLLKLFFAAIEFVSCGQ